MASRKKHLMHRVCFSSDILCPYYLSTLRSFLIKTGLQRQDLFSLLLDIITTSRTVMPLLSVITLRDPLIAHAALDTLEMEHHAPVNHHVQYALKLYMRSETEAHSHT